MNKVLTKEQARNLLVTQVTSEHNRDSSFLSQADKKLLYEAAKSKRKTVTFDDGKKFNISYAKQKSIAWGGGAGYDACYITPADGSFVPCGWFHIDFLLSEKRL